MKDKDRDKNKKNKKSFKKASKGGESNAVAVIDKYPQVEPVQAQPLQVIVYNNNVEKALKAFRALVQKERLLSTYKEKQSYEKPSQKRRRKRNEMKRKLLELSRPRKERVEKTKQDS